MKLNKLASAVSVSLAALALTACGSSDDDKPIPNTPTAVVDGAQAAIDQAKIDAVKAAAVAKGLDEGDAAKFANANKDIDVNSPAFDDAIEAFNKSKTDTGASNSGSDSGVNDTISTEITKADPWLAGFDAERKTSVQASHYIRDRESNFDRARNQDDDKTSHSGIMATETLQNEYLTNYILSAEGDDKQVWAVSYIGEYYDKDKKDVVDMKVIEPQYKYVKKDGTIVSSQDDNEFKVETGAQKRGTIQDHDAVIIADQGTAFKDFAKGELNEELGNTSGLYIAKQDISVRNTEDLKFVVGNIESVGGAKVALFGKNKGTNKQLWFDGERVNSTDKIKAAKADGTIPVNSYKADFDAEGKLTSFDPIRLVNAQYGRLTTHLDALAENPDPEGTGYVLIPRPFVAQTTDATVDVYFYRGTNETTEAQMNAIKAKGGELEYRGHALTYGLDKDVLLVDGDLESKSRTNAFDRGVEGYTKEAFGNFVAAKFDTATGNVTGEIYNFVRTDSESPFKKNDLVTFNGSTHINTVLGSATRKATNEEGNFRGSFFGEGAEELGGNISSVKNGYGAGTWGAVFGAEKVATKGDDPKTDPKPTGVNYDVNDTTTIDKVINKGP